jgi:surface polysaccharide O-acyltransferase-like enzyme
MLNFHSGIYLPVKSEFMFYLLLGYYIHHYEIKIKNTVLVFLNCLYILCVFLMGFNKNSIPFESSMIIYLDYYSPIVALESFVLFCFFRQQEIKNKIFDILSPLCFGIYLTHAFFIGFIYRFINMTPEKYPLLIAIMGTLFLTVLLSLGFSWSARKIKIIKEYIL